MFKKIFFTGFTLLISIFSWTQHKSHISSESHYEGLTDFLKSGHFGVHFRNNMMSTINDGALSDYYGWGWGGGLDYKSAEFKGFSFQMSGFAIFDIASSNFEHVDPMTSNTSRYELALFDMNEPDNRVDLDRLELMYLKYHYKNSIIKFGRQIINTPLLNEQDNRMRPNLFSGLYLETQPVKNLKWRNAIIAGVSPRGTVDWYSMEGSMGVYSFGRHTDGSPSNYKGNTKSAGLIISGLDYVYKNGEAYLWYYHAENIFNLAFFQNDYSIILKDTAQQIVSGIQGFFQQRSGNGGNIEPVSSYFLKNAHVWSVGARLGYQFKRHQVSSNYLYISDGGRFLFPREWGREQFYVSLPRERFEGMGNVNALNVRYDFEDSKTGWRAMLGAGISNLPGHQNYELNKYGVPSFYHYAFRLRKEFHKKWNGFAGEFLMVYKQSINEVAYEYRINRVNMMHFNLVLDYKV